MTGSISPACVSVSRVPSPSGASSKVTRVGASPPRDRPRPDHAPRRVELEHLGLDPAARRESCPSSCGSARRPAAGSRPSPSASPEIDAASGQRAPRRARPGAAAARRAGRRGSSRVQPPAAGGRAAPARTPRTSAVQSWTTRSGCGLQPVDPPAPFRPPLDDTGVEQHAQVLRDERVREPRRLDEGADRPLAVAESVEQHPPVPLGDRVKRVSGGTEARRILFKRSLKRQARRLDRLASVAPRLGGRPTAASAGTPSGPACCSSSSVPPITRASSSAIASPSPLPDACEPSPR